MIAPIVLYGFDFNAQSHQTFNTPWGAAWLTKKYTDEEHEVFTWFRDDIAKQREIKYGNNIYVLFRALLHCSPHYGEDGFWHAIALGFSGGADKVQEMVSTLSRARRIQRTKPAGVPSETARAVDDWNSFVDSFKPIPRKFADPSLNSIAQQFYKNMERKVVNAARIPRGPSFSNKFNSYRPSEPEEEEAMSRRSPLPPSATPTLPPPPLPLTATTLIKAEKDIDSNNWDRLLGPGRKRSLSPPPPGPMASPRSKRPRQSTGDWPPPGQQDSHQPSPGSTSSGRFQPPRPREERYTDESSGPSHQLSMEENSVLRRKVASLENKKAELEGQLKGAAVIRELEREISGFRSGLKSMDSIMGTIMDSMQAIAETLDILKEDVSGLKARQASSKSETVGEVSDLKSQSAQPPPPCPGVNDTQSFFQPIQAIADSVKELRSEISDLKAQQQQQQQEQHKETPATVGPDLEGPIREQNDHIDRLAREMAQMRNSLAVSSATRPVPQNIRQAMAAAEQDLKHHRDIVQRFYDRMESSGSYGVSRAVTENAADLFLALDQGLQFAQLGQRN
ncbi:hypothetical protein B0T22DRAFT_376881 [Podospora appendiculata]|uniref:Uncharacterized protein n=1 Tax=Podospora appendiculata TaxID=314037 RepID=A0AAE1CDB8_9PEZI|nr:hypothetical protein B0T22DRAFT_376881 [Podospora appendiculata]